MVVGALCGQRWDKQWLGSRYRNTKNGDTASSGVDIEPPDGGQCPRYPFIAQDIPKDLCDVDEPPADRWKQRYAMRSLAKILLIDPKTYGG